MEKVCQLLGIWQYFDAAYINIRLWRGPADKNLMISEIFAIHEQQNVKALLVDDSDRYSQQMADAGHGFILSPKDSFPKDAILDFLGFKIN